MLMCCVVEVCGTSISERVWPQDRMVEEAGTTCNLIMKVNNSQTWPARIDLSTEAYVNWL
jgi:hypothetical protein